MRSVTVHGVCSAQGLYVILTQLVHHCHANPTACGFVSSPGILSMFAYSTSTVYGLDKHMTYALSLVIILITLLELLRLAGTFLPLATHLGGHDRRCLLDRRLDAV